MNIEETELTIDLAPSVCFSTQVPSLLQANHSFSFFYINMRSIARRMVQLEAVLAAIPFNPDVIVVAETWIYEGEGHFFNIPNYIAFHSGRPIDASRGDGCAVFVRDHLSPILIESKFFEGTSIIVLDIPIINAKVIGIYRPPKTPTPILFPILDQLLSQFKHAIW